MGSSIGGKSSSSGCSVARTANNDLGATASTISRRSLFTNHSVFAGQFEFARNLNGLMVSIPEQCGTAFSHSESSASQFTGSSFETHRLRDASRDEDLVLVVRRAPLPRAAVDAPNHEDIIMQLSAKADNDAVVPPLSVRRLPTPHWPSVPRPRCPRSAQASSLSEVSPLTPTAPSRRAAVLDQHAAGHRHHPALRQRVHRADEIGLLLRPLKQRPRSHAHRQRAERPCHGQSRLRSRLVPSCAAQALTQPRASRMVTTSGFSFFSIALGKGGVRILRATSRVSSAIIVSFWQGRRRISSGEVRRLIASTRAT